MVGTVGRILGDAVGQHRRHAGLARRQGRLGAGRAVGRLRDPGRHPAARSRARSTPTRSAPSASCDGRPARSQPLADLGPVAQLRAGRLPRRLIQLYAGLVLYGASLALMVRGELGLAPWDVLHSGFIRHVPITLGPGRDPVQLRRAAAVDPAARGARPRHDLERVVVGLAADATLAVLDRARPARRCGSGCMVAGRGAQRPRDGDVHRRPVRPRPARRPDDRARAA